MDCPPDWDLLALVRSCSTTTATTTVTPPRQPPPPPLKQEQVFDFSAPFSTTSFHAGLHDVCKPIMGCTTPDNKMSYNNGFQTLSCSSSSYVRPSHGIFGTATRGVSRGGATSHSQRTKKRKNIMKKVCHVPAEGLSSDMWAWRKYGQKPIKGSPYPRGYYRCSSSKGCMARKQVERNRSDPKMFIVTYTSEHNHPMPTHRNSLAGSTRQKPLTPTGTPPENPTCSSPSASTLSPLTEPSESKTEDNDMGVLSDLLLNDDFYVGFEQIDGGSDDSDCFSEQFSPSLEFPWLSNGGPTVTAAGGS